MATRPTPEAARLVDWVTQTSDARGKPFAIVDKRAARLYVFHADGRLAGHTPALLGSAPGDHTLPGTGERTQNGTLRPEDRTTPAGRFDSEAGVNATGEHVVWVDYASAFAIHRLRPGFAYQARASRLASTQSAGRRVSWGCVVVPVPFYTQVVQRVLGQGRSVVYVMPENMPVQQVFNAL
ncbi:L,D-transpeptidase [Ramlibacter cellulosilyticus]|nr:L,D-transpeptidase [Ramlibacter cellulosilyticus]